ncbi:hypothetical protein NDU88_008189 [Pleurodeles waltl]|uniref:Uncharacterized protein n=1 Tax=Pleurodeles waltl TaxID=8319 RepID=A0AAV7NV84_PLEWA|nr:hypothetical protein NDU88_008189 [Pleurodeles waltl]
MDLKILDLSAASASIRTDIACFCEKVMDLDQRLMTVEEHVAMMPNMTKSCDPYEQRSQTLRTGARVTMSVSLAYRNTKKVPTSKPSLKACSPNSLAWTSHCRSRSKEHIGLALSIRQPLGDPVLPSHVSSTMIRLAWLSQPPGLKVRTLWRAMRSEWQQTSPG